jgi:hypothetical protein
MKQIFKNKKVLLFIAFVFALSLEIFALKYIENSQEPVFGNKNNKAKSHNEWLPKWMPTTWCKELLRQFAQSDIDPNFENSLEELYEKLKKITWVDSVKKISRDYRSNFNVDIKIKTPICLIKGYKRMGYLDKNGEFMKPLGVKNLNVLKDGTELPVINAEKISPKYVANKEDMGRWFDDLVAYLLKWEKEKEINSRYSIKKLDMTPYRNRSYSSCRFILHLFDKKYRKGTVVEWGFSENENALESRTGDQKWESFRHAAIRSAYFNSLDLRYNVSNPTL